MASAGRVLPSARVCDMGDPGLRFVDLFSGLGGFHVALSRLGHECVFAAEIDSDLRELYHLNFGIRPASDIRFSWKDVPEHDVLCAGFPCQPFSKAGSQSGFSCPDPGDLFDYILRIVDRHNPRFLLLENVPNILRHDDEATWRRIRKCLRARGYSLRSREISPHQIGVPQMRNRAIIVACNLGLEGFRWPELNGSMDDLHISTVLDDPSPGQDELPEASIRYLEVWQDFLDRVGGDALLSGLGNGVRGGLPLPATDSRDLRTKIPGPVPRCIRRPSQGHAKTPADRPAADLREGHDPFLSVLEGSLHHAEQGILCRAQGQPYGLAP